MSGTGEREHPAPPGLGVQVVIYQHTATELVRLAGAVRATVAAAQTAGAVGTVVVRFGDCSPSPAIDGEAETRIRAALEPLHTTFTCFDANLGSAGGSNALAALGDEELIWVLNPDTYPAPTCARELASAFTDPAIAAVEARQIPVEHPKWYDPATGGTSWVSGACVMVRRTAFSQVDGFDAEVFPLYCDDVDLSWRLRLAGWQLRHVPHAVVFHDKRPFADGAVRWSATEARSSTLARLCMYRRYGRPDLEATLLADLDRGDETARTVADEFRRLVHEGRVPQPLPSVAGVAEFVDGHFGPRRFAYAS